VKSAQKVGLSVVLSAQKVGLSVVLSAQKLGLSVVLSYYINKRIVRKFTKDIKEASHKSIDWCLTPTLAVFQLCLRTYNR